MRKQTLFWLMVVVLFGVALFWAQSPAHAHAQIYPHVHPHRDPGGFTDMCLALLFVYGSAGAYVLVSRLLRKRDRKVRK